MAQAICGFDHFSRPLRLSIGQSRDWGLFLELKLTQEESLWRRPAQWIYCTRNPWTRPCWRRSKSRKWWELVYKGRNKQNITQTEAKLNSPTFLVLGWTWQWVLSSHWIQMIDLAIVPTVSEKDTEKSQFHFLRSQKWASKSLYPFLDTYTLDVFNSQHFYSDACVFSDLWFRRRDIETNLILAMCLNT